MANSLLNTQKLALDAAVILQNQMPITSFGARKISGEFEGKVGDRVSIMPNTNLGYADENSTGVPSITSAVNQKSRDVVLEKYLYKKITLTAKEQRLYTEDENLEFILPSLRSVAKSAERYNSLKLAGGFAANISGTPGVSPTTQAHMLSARKVLRDNGVDTNGLLFNYDSAAEAAYSALNIFQSADYGADKPAILRDGNASLGTAYGALWMASQDASATFDQGDVAGTVLVKGASQDGDSVSVDGFTAGSGIVKEGFRFTLAGISGVTFSVTEDAVIAGNAAVLKISPALPSSPADNAALTGETAFKQNILYRPDAANIAVVAPAPIIGADSSIATFNNISVRVTVQGSTSDGGNTLLVDTFLGARVIVPEAGVIVQG